MAMSPPTPTATVIDRLKPDLPEARSLPRSRSARIGGIAVFVGLMVVLLLSRAWSDRVEALANPGAAALVATDQAQARPRVPADAAEVARLVQKRPLDQDMVNLLYALRVRNGLSAEREQDYIKAVASLGWRSDAAQTNLLWRAIGQQDLETLVSRADGLMRRGQSEKELLELLRAFESEPQARRYLVESLRRNPPWRLKFLEQASRLRTNAQRLARYELVSNLLDEGVDLSRREVSVTLRPLYASGLHEQAWSLYNHYLGREESSQLLTDGDFTKVARLQSSTDRSSLLFEWVVPRGRGLNPSVRTVMGSGEIVIRWNGAGTPQLLRQSFHLEESAPLALKLDGIANGNEFNAKILIEAKCPDGSSVRFNPVQLGKALAFHTDAPVACAFPQLVFSGRPTLERTPARFRIASAELLTL